ncbi:MAG: hypothetical protein JWN07_3543 [Hyphomicrobiales bacterium]|nr:hypothetical protein [Hyphomicrobiales bacterium]
MHIGPEMVALITESLKKWKYAEIDDMAYRFREDAVLSSAFLPDERETVWLQGRDEVLSHLRYIRSTFVDLDVIDISTDTILYVVRLQADAQALTVVVEPDLSNFLIKKMVICRSIHQMIPVQ